MALLRGRPDNSPEEIYNGVDWFYEIAGNNFGSWHTFTKPTRAIVFTSRYEGAYFQVSEDMVILSDWIGVYPDTAVTVTLQTKYYRVRNMKVDHVAYTFVNGFYLKE